MYLLYVSAGVQILFILFHIHFKGKCIINAGVLLATRHLHDYDNKTTKKKVSSSDSDCVLLKTVFH